MSRRTCKQCLLWEAGQCRCLTREAAAAGIPQLAGKSGGAEEAVLEGMTGKVVSSPKDVDSVKEAICEILDDETRYEEMKLLSRERAETKFSYDNLALQFHDSLLKLNEN